MRIFNNINRILKRNSNLSTKTGQIKQNSIAFIPLKDNKKTRNAMKEIESNRNHSWYEEIYERNKNRLDSVALIYRDNEVTYQEMFDKMQEVAKSLLEYGIKKGDEIPICLGNTPELVYLMGAASMIGAKVNIFGPKFSPDYVTKIINETNSSIVFIEDNNFEKLRDSIEKSNAKDTVLISLAESLNNGIHPLESKNNIPRFTSKVNEFKDNYKYVKSFNDFKKIGQEYHGNIISEVSLDDEFSITYTSGSTNAKYPKQIVHNNRSFIMIARHHDKDMSGGVDMSKYINQAHLPTYSNTDLISCISDSLMQGSRLALEPIPEADHFIDSLIINKPNIVIATTSYWIKAMKDAMYNEKYKGVTIPSLLIGFAAGEGLSVNEEKFLNKGLRKVKAGTNFLPSILKGTVMSAGGGDCEHGSIFYSLFRRLTEHKNSKGYIKEPGLKVMDFAELAVLDKDGYYCNKGEYGRIVANSGCTMEYYKNDPEATKKFFIKDAYGKEWGDCSIYGFVDKKNKVHIKGRIPKEGEILPTFLINDEVLKDQDNILSSVTVNVKDEGEDKYVVHFEKMPETKKDSIEIMNEALTRIDNKLGNEVSSKILFREHDFEESFKLTGSGKRDYYACQNEGITDKAISINKDDNIQRVLKK